MRTKGKKGTFEFRIMVVQLASQGLLNRFVTICTKGFFFFLRLFCFVKKSGNGSQNLCKMRTTTATKMLRDIYNSVALHTPKKDPADLQQNMNNWLGI